MARRLNPLLARDRSLVRIPRKAAKEIAAGGTKIVIAGRFQTSPFQAMYLHWGMAATRVNGRFVGTLNTSSRLIVVPIKAGYHGLRITSDDTSLCGIDVEVRTGSTTYVAIAPSKSTIRWLSGPTVTATALLSPTDLEALPMTLLTRRHLLDRRGVLVRTCGT